MSLSLDTVGEGIMFSGCRPSVRPPVSFVRLSKQILLPRYLMNGLNNFDKTDWEYSLSPMMTWLDSGGQRSKVKVTAGCRGGEGVHVGIDVHLLFYCFQCLFYL